MINEELDRLTHALETWSQTHRYDLIIDTALKILAIDPHNKFAYDHLVRAYNNTHNFDKLYEILMDGLAKWPDDDYLYYMLYLYYLSHGGIEYLKARDAIKKAIELNPRHAKWYRELGEIYLINREPDKAENYLMQAVKLNPDNPEFRSRLALAQIRLHKVKESLDAINKSLKDAPDDQLVLDNAGMVYTLSGDIEKAEELFRDALVRHPTSTYLQSHLDWVLREKADKASRSKRGLPYTPLHIRQKSVKRHFDEEAGDKAVDEESTKKQSTKLLFR